MTITYKICDTCGKLFPATHKGLKYCSDECRARKTFAAERRVVQEWIKDKACDIRLLKYCLDMKEKELDEFEKHFDTRQNPYAVELSRKRIYREMQPIIKRIYELRFKFFYSLNGLTREEKKALYNHYVFDKRMAPQELKRLLVKVYFLKKGEVE